MRITPFGIRLSSWTRGADSVSERHGAMSRGSTYACVRQLQKATWKKSRFIFSHWGSGQSRKIKTTTQVRDTPQKAISLRGAFVRMQGVAAFPHVCVCTALFVLKASVAQEANICCKSAMLYDSLYLLMSHMYVLVNGS